MEGVIRADISGLSLVDHEPTSPVNPVNPRNLGPINGTNRGGEGGSLFHCNNGCGSNRSYSCKSDSRPTVVII